MNTWQIISELLHGANFYWRKFFVFSILVVVAGTGFLVWKNQTKIEAAVKITEAPLTTSVSQLNTNIEITAKGKVLINGRDYTETLKILPNFYEISILALEEPGVYIGQFQAQIHLPKPVNPDAVRQRIIAIHGAENSYQAFVLDPQTLVYIVNAVPPQGQVTLVAELPKDAFQARWDKRLFYAATQIPAKTYIIFSVVFPLAIMIVLAFMAFRRRQDQIFHVSKKVSPELPTDSPPAVVGALVDGQVGAREIAATLIDLASRGYLYITAKANGQFTFGKRKTLNLEQLPELRQYERLLLSKIFEPTDYKSTRNDVDMRVGRHIFSRKIAEVYLNIYNETTSLGYFVQNPVNVHLRWKYAGILFFFAGIVGFAVSAAFTPDPKFTLFFWVGEIAASAVIVRLSALMPARSLTGTLAVRKWLEFQNYLKLRQPIEPGTNRSEKYAQLLPYALVLGLETEWTRRFYNENFTKPDWFDSEEQVITLERFVSSLFPIIQYVGGSLDRSHEPTVE